MRMRHCHGAVSKHAELNAVHVAMAAIAGEAFPRILFLHTAAAFHSLSFIPFPSSIALSFSPSLSNFPRQAFVDLETTGGAAAQDRIPEVGIIEVTAEGE